MVRIARAVRRIWWLELLLVAVVVTLGVGGFVRFRDRATPLTVGEAVARFRQSAAPAHPASGVPEPGVYVYATDGWEEVDVLGGARHDYPARTTITVVRSGCGLRIRWDALVQRWDEGETCTEPGRWTARRYVTSHEFFQRRDRRDFVCDAGALVLPASPDPGARWSLRCRTDDTTLVSRGTVVAGETLSIEGRPVETVHLRLVTDLRGATSGTRTADVWLARANGLMIRTVARAEGSARSVVGTVRYRERYELNLLSLLPRR